MILLLRYDPSRFQIVRRLHQERDIPHVTDVQGVSRQMLGQAWRDDARQPNYVQIFHLCETPG
jgi:hypothetical protein